MQPWLLLLAVPALVPSVLANPPAPESATPRIAATRPLCFGTDSGNRGRADVP